MKSKRGYLLFVVMLVVLGVLTTLTLLGVQFLRQRQERARWEYPPPVVQIIEPQNGISAPVGSYLSAVSTITFSPQNPVQTVEWWLDGALAESHSLQAGAGGKYDSYDLLIPTEGTHMLVARAINTRGVIGQSQPLTFQGMAKGEAFYAVTVNEGETLESLAAGYGSEVATLQTLNPGLGNPPPAGTTIKVPIPPENEPPSPPQTPPAVSGGVTLVSTSPMLKVANIPSNSFSLLAVAPPPAPTNLQGEVKDCQVKLLWEDNAANESGYEVWMAAPGAPLTLLATLQPASGGVTWFEFQAPGPGYFLFWVEAVNPIGQQGSNIIHLNVDAGCPIGAPTYLQVEILDIAASASAERIYCYVSFENAPEVRLPAQDGDFIAVQGGHGSLTLWPHTFSMPIPADGALDLSGECWGWAGQDLSKMGTFTASLGSETWDGTSHLAHGGTFDVSLSALAQGGTKMILQSTAIAGKAIVNVRNYSGRTIDAVYFTLSGQTDWGNNLLGSNPIFIGNTGTFEIGVGNYDLRAYCCGDLPLARKLNVSISGTYEWNVLAALDVYNDTDMKVKEWQFPVEEFYFTTSQPGKYFDYGVNQLISEEILPGEARRWYLHEGIYSLKAKLSDWVYQCDHINISGVTDYYISSNTYIVTDGNTGERKSIICK